MKFKILHVKLNGTGFYPQRAFLDPTLPKSNTWKSIYIVMKLRNNLIVWGSYPDWMGSQSMCHRDSNKHTILPVLERQVVHVPKMRPRKRKVVKFATI